MIKELLRKYFKKKKKKRKPIYAKNIVYDLDNVYMLYCIVRNNFNYCMRNRLLKRKDILEFKFMLNKFVNQNEFKHETFQNDAHEIYRKLKSKSISKKNMLKLNDFLQPFIQQEVVSLPTEQPIKRYENLLVIK